MLISFKFSNFRNYYHENSLSFVAEKERQFYEENTFPVDQSLYDGRLLNSLIVMGINGAGKSNLIKSLIYFQFLVLYSSEANKKKRNIFRDNNEKFAFFEDAESSPMTFEIEFITSDNYYYNYAVSIENDEVVHEILYERVQTGKKRLDNKKCLFERIGTEIKTNVDSFKKLREFIDVIPNVLFISSCNSDIKEELCPSGKRFVNWFKELRFVNEDTTSLGLYDKKPELLHKAAKILSITDKSLSDLNIVKTKIDIPVEDQNNPQAIFNAIKQANLSFEDGELSILDDGVYLISIDAEYNIYKSEHDKSLSSKGKAHFSVLNQSNKISAGQSKLINSLAPVFDVLENGGILFWDELDSRLHHQFPELIINAFNNRNINKKNAQLLFTTHNPLLMDKQFRRDQIYIVQKDEYGVSTLSHPERSEGRIKKTNRLSNLWLNDELISSKIVTVNDLTEILS